MNNKVTSCHSQRRTTTFRFQVNFSIILLASRQILPWHMKHWGFGLRVNECHLYEPHRISSGYTFLISKFSSRCNKSPQNLITREHFGPILFHGDNPLWRRIWGTYGELCAVWPQSYLNYHLHWLEMVREWGETQNVFFVIYCYILNRTSKRLRL